MAVLSTNYSLKKPENAVAVTPSDSADLAAPAYHGLYVGTTGNIALVTTNNKTVTFNSVPVGILPVSVQRVLSTGTTASNIVALY